MKPRQLLYMCCQKCGGGGLITTVKEEKDGEIWEATMWCQGCNINYHINNGMTTLQPCKNITDLDVKNVNTDIKLNIIIAHRPFSVGCCTSPNIEMVQLPDGRWNHISGEYKHSGMGKWEDIDELVRAIQFLNKNSRFKHNIVIVMDHDIYPHKNYLKEFDNVTILKTKDYKIGDKIGNVIEYLPSAEFESLSGRRYNTALAEGVASIPDEEWICLSYMDDLICSKDWDKYIIDAIQKYGEDFVYVPMPVEVRDFGFPKGSSYTHEHIWDEWRRTIINSRLLMPQTIKGYFTEEDMENYIKIANDAKKLMIIERSGDRIYGTWGMGVMKAKAAKKVMRVEQTWELRYDDRLRDELGMMKVVSTRSFLFHPITCPFKY